MSHHILIKGGVKLMQKLRDKAIINNAIDLMVMMVVDELSEDMQKPPSELLPEFVISRTGKLLYEESSKLWWSGPSAIAQMYKEEIL